MTRRFRYSDDEVNEPTHACQCEHVSHFDPSKNTPDGHPGHQFGARYVAHVMRTVETTCGPLRVCLWCDVDCQRNAPCADRSGP